MDNVRKPGLLKRLKEGLSKTRKGISEKIDSLVRVYTKIDDEFFEELEEILITSDVGVRTSVKIIEQIKEDAKQKKIADLEQVRAMIKQKLVEILEETQEDDHNDDASKVIIVVGVNGVGKTTTIGKMASKFKEKGKSVLLVAADTFRAAAAEQLEIWGERTGVGVIKQVEGSDPAAVVFDGISAAKARNIDVLICDTAGRLHNKKNLMNELSKIRRVIDREYPEAVKEVLLVLDATTGQNAINQAKIFKEAVDIDGVVLTKLDGTAKGGVVIGVKDEVGIPVKMIGVGERVEDLQEFNAEEFINALFEG
ncbi:MAG: signal recognition particle-docking protein FtsY [Clostridia bacterium]|nr:signal recognition particle-docking protein FtsY [Clostridia bacterium]